MRNWLQRFMTGRYGTDQLNMFMLVLAIVLSLLANILNFSVLSIIGFVLIILCFIRMLSRNLYARRKENDRFIKVWWPIRTKITNKFHQLKDSRKYKYFSCPACHATLRVPRGKGKIAITCPKCGERSIKKS